MHRFRGSPRVVLAVVSVVVAALGVATSLTQAAAKTTTRTISCRAALVATKPLGEAAENFGTVNCGAPLGKGVHHDTSRVDRQTQSSGTFAGPVKLFFNTGTLRGTYKTTFSIDKGTVLYDGTMKLTSGTGAFTGVTGTGTITGTGTDGVRSTMREKLTLKFPVKKTA